MKQLLVVITHCTLLIAAAKGGGKEGSGGSTVVCRDATGAIQSVEFLDLYEGQEEYRLNIEKKSGTAEEQARAMEKRLLLADPDYFAPFRKELDFILERKNVLDKGVGVNPVYDSFPTLFKKDCKIEQLANYKGNGVVHIDGDFWEKMGETDRAALYVHEAVYKLIRDTEPVLAKDSAKARIITGHLFSDLSDTAFVRAYDRFIHHYKAQGKTDLQIEEEIRSEIFLTDKDVRAGKAKELAKISWDLRCAEWRQEVQNHFGKKLRYFTCGSGFDISVRLNWKNIENDYGENGYRQGGGWGWAHRSVGLIITQIKGQPQVAYETVQSMKYKYSGPKKNESTKAEALKLADADYHRACLEWKEKINTSFLGGVIYPLCTGDYGSHGYSKRYQHDSDTDHSSSSNSNEYVVYYESRGKILFIGN